jgi:hypothetical protein
MCHTHPHNEDHPTDDVPNYTGHQFTPMAEACTVCHTFWDEEAAEAVIESMKATVAARIQDVKAVLDDWGLNRSPDPLRETYGALAWEFQTVGQISNPTGDPSIRGPSSAEQSGVPDSIKKARFLLYLVEHDASYGAHNPTYVVNLLEQAKQLVEGTP